MHAWTLPAGVVAVWMLWFEIAVQMGAGGHDRVALCMLCNRGMGAGAIGNGITLRMFGLQVRAGGGVLVTFRMHLEEIGLCLLRHIG